MIDIEATIVCERDSHKGIIIGKGGSMLKKIGTSARMEIGNLMAVMLEPVGDRRHHKSDDGTDSEKLDDRCQDAHKVEDNGSDDNAADDAPNAQRQNAGIAKRAVDLLGVLTHERIITPSGSILS